MTEYRKRLYSDYARHQQNRLGPPGTAEQNAWYRNYSFYLRNWLPEDRNAFILDLGCGAGLLLSVFKRMGYARLKGIDASESQVTLARAVTDSVTVEDALPFLERCEDEYDLICAIDLIEHLTKNEVLAFRDACLKALKPGGRLILQTPNGESPWVGSVFHGDFTHETCFTPLLLAGLLASAGFESVETRPCGPVPTDMIGWIRFQIWQGITLVCRCLNLIEGAVTAGIYTRTFLISARKPSARES